MDIRTTRKYAKGCREAETTQTNIYGHLGESVLEGVVDVPFPNCIVLDYLHVTLLGHAKAIILSIYRSLKPAQRVPFDAQVRRQSFPRKFLAFSSSICYD